MTTPSDGAPSSARSVVALLERAFDLSARGTSVRTELVAGITTFLTMAYIIVVQPAVLSGAMFGHDTGMPAGAVMTATCLAAALATALMGLYARAPIAQAPGMGENFFFVLTAMPAAAAAGYTGTWQVALGIVFVSGVLFLALTVAGLRRHLVEAIPQSLRAGIGVGIGLFIAFIGLQNAGLIVKDPATAVRLDPNWLAPNLLVFFCGLLVTAALQARRTRGALIVGMVVATAFALFLREAQGVLGAHGPAWDKLDVLALPSSLLALPPDLSPTLLALDLRGALSLAMLPFVLVFLLMLIFDTIGTLVGVTEGLGLAEKGALPEPDRAYLSDAVGTVAGALLGTSTVTSYIESAAGVEQGGRTGLTALVVAALFLVALFFSPIATFVGSYPPITAPALVVVGASMLGSATRIRWDDPGEAIPAFLIALGIPLSYSISDGLALGLVTYPIVQVLAGRGRTLRWPLVATAAVLLAYLVALRSL
jgi:AGZA family xanthine/uracil permease-like MFS transporter